MSRKSEIDWGWIMELVEFLNDSLDEFCEEKGDVTPAELSVACSILVHQILSNTDSSLVYSS